MSTSLFVLGNSKEYSHSIVFMISFVIYYQEIFNFFLILPLKLLHYFLQLLSNV